MLPLFSIPTEVKLLQIIPQVTPLLLLDAFDSSVGYFATLALENAIAVFSSDMKYKDIFVCIDHLLSPQISTHTN